MQNAESYWNRVKTKLKRMKGCHAHQILSYLDEFMWWERYGQNKRVAFNSIMRDIARQYPARVAITNTSPTGLFQGLFSELLPTQKFLATKEAGFHQKQ